MSDLYFAWTNAVVAGVPKQYPDKWFGLLANSEVAAPPSKIKVHPRIISFMTYDRMKWVVPSYESEGKKLTEQWLRQASVLGWYDSSMGRPILCPVCIFIKWRIIRGMVMRMASVPCMRRLIPIGGKALNFILP
jgi:hypothetical protein